MKKFIKLLTAGILTAITAIALIACAPADLEKAEEKMKNEGYSVVVAEDDYGAIDGCVGFITITDSEGIFDLNAEVAIAYLFEDAKSAKTYYESLDSGWNSGKWVIVGDEDIYEDFVG